MSLLPIAVYLMLPVCRVLECTVVTALFATNAGFVYLLSWVVLHNQFVGVRVSSVFCRQGYFLEFSRSAFWESHFYWKRSRKSFTQFWFCIGLDIVN